MPTRKPGDRDGSQGPLGEYRRKRDPRRTPEPMPADGSPEPPSGRPLFVVQQHHARRLHWDLRLERNGVLASWAVPRGVPLDPKRNHLAVRTEDHPMAYADFAGEIPAGEYGAGHMTIFDRGWYEAEKWRDTEVIVVLHGDRLHGRYALIRTGGRGGADDRNWLLHRMDPPPPGWQPMPDDLRPMRPVAGGLPAEAHDDEYCYEMRWGGTRALAFAASGQLRLLDADGADITATYPELRGMADALAGTDYILDGEIVVFDEAGQLDPDALRERNAVTAPARARRLADERPVTYLANDILHAAGRSTMDSSYVDRRKLLASLAVAGRHWQTPPYFPGDGARALATAREQGLPGVVAKRANSPYTPGGRSRAWLTVSSRRR